MGSRATALKIRTRDIPASWLNAHCRNLISKYALAAYGHDQSMFDLRGDNILLKISEHAKKTNSDELSRLYSQLKKELKVVLACPSLKSEISMMAEKSAYLNDHFSH